MKYLTFILFLIISFHFAYSQEEIDSKQMIIGVDGVSASEEVDHNVEPIGTYWEINTTTQVWSISSDPLGEASTITTVGNSNFNDLAHWPGWNFFWLENTAPTNEDWALGFYKVSYIPEIQDNNEAYFYIDCRVDKYGEVDPPYNNPDFFVYIDVSEDFYNIGSAVPPPWDQIDDGEVVRIWDVFDVDPPSSNSLPGYWSRVLLLIEGGDDHPRFAWGPHPSFTTTHFYIYRAVAEIPVNPKEQLTFELTGITNSTTYEFIDTQFEIGGSTTYIAFYYVKAYNSSSSTYSLATNGVSTTGEYVPHKISVNPPEGIQVDEFDLVQNYPNPFNPTTVINFSVSKNSFATLKVYDILGNEVAVLLNNTIEAGDHSVEFNAADLPSGIYLYKFQAGEISLIRKMILLR